MDTPTERSREDLLRLRLYARLIDLGYGADDYVTARVAVECAGDDLPSDARLHEAAARARVVRDMQQAFA